MRHLKKTEYVLSGILALLGAFPYATRIEIHNGMPSLAGAAVTVRDVLENRGQLRLQRRKYEECLVRLEAGDVESCSINEAKNGKSFFRMSFPIDETTADDGVTAPEDETSATRPILTLQDLTAGQRGLLREARRAAFCPRSLSNVMPGLYDLCLSLVRTPYATQGLVNERARIEYHNAAQPTLEDRIDTFEGARPDR